MTLDLFGATDYPPGFVYKPGVLSVDEEREVLEQVSRLPFKAFEFHGFEGKRRVVSFGFKYDFSSERLREVEPVPGFLVELSETAGAAVGVAADAFRQVLVTEYGPGAAIGWHKDKRVFGKIVGVSLGSACTMRFRRGGEGKWERKNLELEPRSVYLLSGEVRSAWEHSIPPVAETRYSITLRTLA